MRIVQLTVNGVSHEVNVWPMARLMDVLREDIGLTGTKEGCGEGECGACAVLLDGELVNSCLIPVMQANGSKIVTIEGLSGSLQEAFLQTGGAQCGICTPGMIMAAHALLERIPKPMLDDIREGLAGNLCRCTGYQKIFDAVTLAAKSA